MNPIFMREQEGLKEKILLLAGDVEMRLTEVLKATEQRDKDALYRWIDRDSEIDGKEVQIEEECLKILALHQPVAKDLRFVVAVLKINNDLERIGDIVVNIAQKGIPLADTPVGDIFSSVIQMGRVSREMVKDALDALVNLDLEKANAVIRRDDDLDTMRSNVWETVAQRATATNVGSITESLLLLNGVARDLERIGDHATNIAEDVAYLVSGKIVRHLRRDVKEDKHGERKHSDS
ncbi:MAG TPA: phosphate signaling complex protein PhoU [Kiritimatiellia bacterium]|jgi:phosphate transport system protein|nr:phosphate signaling complex protein PhoU [Kiritimatiellia bacterium]HOR98469.1 phosphate signaling complex protein PhoU [Kiritimatiellia bacterium]HRU18903.1 phosphate signaling complex protein PhoU [Kiritimatiellia bacterium]